MMQKSMDDHTAASRNACPPRLRQAGEIRQLTDAGRKNGENYSNHKMVASPNILTQKKLTCPPKSAFGGCRWNDNNIIGV